VIATTALALVVVRRADVNGVPDNRPREREEELVEEGSREGEFACRRASGPLPALHHEGRPQRGSAVTVERETAAVEALRAANISPERHGAARARRLSPGQRELYFWILREFAAARPPTAEGTRVAAASYGVDPVEAYAVLAREDLVHVDATGCPVVAYPFSATPRGHRVLIDGKRWVDAMCAIDALGVAPMLGLPIEIYSHDPASGGEIWVRLDPSEGAWWEPQEAVVVSGSACCEGPSFRGCCDVLNFFEKRESADLYMEQNRAVSAYAISLPEAIEVARIVFGDVFTEAD
jgi:Alkylmercury lyase